MTASIVMVCRSGRNASKEHITYMCLCSLSVRKCLAVEETVVVVLAASAAVAVEDAECILMWSRTQL